MAVMDEFREEREAMKNGTRKQKLEYFWCYYKWHVICTVAAIAIISSFIYKAVTRKDIALYATFLNSYTLAVDDGEAYEQRITEAIGIDTSEYEIMIDNSLYMDLENMTDETTYNTVQKMAVYVAADEIDVLVSNTEVFDYYAYIDYLTDLRTVLTPEQLEAYEPYLYYIDYAVLEAKQEAADNLEEFTGTYPDPTKPEEMEEPVPVGVSLANASEEFNNTYVFKTDAVFGIVVNSPNPENALNFLDFLFESAEE